MTGEQMTAAQTALEPEGVHVAIDAGVTPAVVDVLATDCSMQATMDLLREALPAAGWVLGRFPQVVARGE